MTSYAAFAAIAAIALAAPLLRDLIPAIWVPSVVLEIVLGIVLGPHGLDWIRPSDATRIFAQVGLAVLLYLAGREIDVALLRGHALVVALQGFLLSFALALALGYALGGLALVKRPLLVAIALVASSLSVIIGPLKDAGEVMTGLGQRVIAAGAIAEFGAILLLSVFFSQAHGGARTLVLHLVLFALVVVAAGAATRHHPSLRRVREAFDRLGETTAQIRVRADFACVAGAIALAGALGLEAILAAFAVGVLRGLVGPGQERDTAKLEGVAFGIFVPFFFVSSGLTFDLGALFGTLDAVILLPIFFFGLLVVHGLPALVVARRGGSDDLAAGLLLSTSLSFIVVATQVGLQLHIMRPATAAALIGAGLLSVILFPALALAVLRAGHTLPRRTRAG